MDFIGEKTISEDFLNTEKELENFLNSEGTSLLDFINFEEEDIFSKKVPLLITVLEKTIKNTLVKNKGSIPKELASLYCSYILLATERIDKLYCQLNYFYKKYEAENNYVMSEQKGRAIIEGRDSEAARERWVEQNSSEYKESKDKVFKMYSIFKLFETRQKSIDKLYYLCKSFISNDSYLGTK